MKNAKLSQGQLPRALVVAALALATAAPAVAQVTSPPQLPHEIIVFPQRDFVAIAGFPAGADLMVDVRRNGTLVADAVGTSDASGALEVNHPGGICWRALTPDIVAGDDVQVTFLDTPNNIALGLTPGAGDALSTLDITATQAVIEGDAVAIRGTARTPAGLPIALSLMEVRIVNSAFLDSPGSRIAKRDIRAVEGGAPISGVRGAIGVLEYDAPDSIHWTARFTGLNEAERQLVVEGQTRVLSWMAANENGDRLGITIYEVGEVGGPGFGGCPAGPIPPPAPQPADPPVKYDPAALLDAADPAADLAQLHEIIVFPERDFVAVAGYAAGANLQLVVRRPNVGVIGSARGTTDRSGLLEVNHPGGVCWTGQTPDIRAGDLVDVFEYDDPSLFTAGDETFLGGETQRTVDVRVTAPAFVDATGDVVVLGTAVRPDGSPATDAELAMMEQRIINAEFMNTAVGRRDIRAVVDGGSVGNLAGASSTLQRDPLDPFNWIATYRGLGEAEKRLAVEGQSRAIAWLATNAGGDRFGITIFEFGELGGPGFGGCPQRGDLSIPLP